MELKNKRDFNHVNHTNTMLKKMFSNQAVNTDFALLFLRIVLAFLLARHGYEKFQNLLAGATDFPDPLHIGKVTSLVLTVGAEFFCSILLALGFFSRIALAGLIICMFVIVFVFHFSAPIDDREHGLLYLISFVALLLTGTGKYSFDSWFLKK
jgi:putative oxidoreductase